MELSIIIDYLIISIVASMAINSVLQNYAKQYKLLIDLPDRSRKFHKRPTPLTGGIGIFISLFISGKLYIDLNNLNGYVPNFTYQVIVISIPLIILFVIDDIKGLKPFHRIIAQALSCIYIILTTGVYVENLGDLFGMGDVNLGMFSMPFTVFCVVGVMNAFNMIDGINGLCSGCAMMALLLIGFYSGLIYDSMLILLIGSMMGFLLFNLTIFGKKRAVFLGDHGSNIIGFWVAWAAIYASQNSLYEVAPITMVWFIAIPLLDCIALILSRVRRGISWSKPGRDHIHHKLMDKFSQDWSLLIILVLSLFTGLIGIYIENNYSIWVSTLLFIISSSGYYLLTHYYDSKKINLIKENV
jgi:UDP-GlcNAc:undecaprenyl-phosphate/decaprenyl-phosphate GlcNAc-1-phosphate transferase